MFSQITYTDARANLGTLLGRAVDNREIIYIKRRGLEDVALVAASELSSLMETAHLLRSPKNASRLLMALHRALARQVEPQTVEELRKEIGLEPEG